MKKLIIALSLLLSTAAAQAANNIENYESAVGAEVIVRKVLDGNFLRGENKDYKASLKRALEGSGSSKIYNTLNRITCDRALGTDHCLISVSGAETDSKDAEGGEYSFDLAVTLYQGTILSVRITNQAG